MVRQINLFCHILKQNLLLSELDTKRADIRFLTNSSVHAELFCLRFFCFFLFFAEGGRGLDGQGHLVLCP